MDKLATYRVLIKQILNQHANLIKQSSSGDVGTHTIFDKTHDHYMIFRTGWRGNIFQPISNECSIHSTI